MVTSQRSPVRRRQDTSSPSCALKGAACAGRSASICASTHMSSRTASRICDSLDRWDGLDIRCLTLCLRVLVAKLHPTLWAQVDVQGAFPGHRCDEDHRGSQFAFTVFERTFKEFGLPQGIRTDNGVPFASAHALDGLSKLAVWSLRLGIQIERIMPGHPQQNGRHGLAAMLTRARSSSDRCGRQFQRATRLTRPPESRITRRDASRLIAFGGLSWVWASVPDLKF